MSAWRIFDRRSVLRALGTLPAVPSQVTPMEAQAHVSPAQATPLASWNEGPAKQAILDFVRATTDQASKDFVPVEQRIATFNQDGTLWVEYPIYNQIIYCLDQVPALVAQNQALKNVEPFKTVLSGNSKAIAKLSLPDLEKIGFATLTGMTTDEFHTEVSQWLDGTKDARWERPYTDLVYQPMLEVMHYLRDNGYKTYIVTGGGQDFVRVYSQRVYGIPPEQVVGSSPSVKYGYDKDGNPILIKEPKLVLDDNNAGKPEGIHLMIGQRPRSATPPAMSRCSNIPVAETASV